MTHTPVTIAYIGGCSLNWATKLMADLAYDADPLVAPLFVDAARRTFTEMVQATARHLPHDLQREAA